MTGYDGFEIIVSKASPEDAASQSIRIFSQHPEPMPLAELYVRVVLPIAIVGSIGTLVAVFVNLIAAII